MPATSNAPRKKKQRVGKRGPPSKKNDALVKRLIETARLGLPMSVVAPRCGISRETLSVWMAADAALNTAIEQARAEAMEEAWKKIMLAGDSGQPSAWQSIAWRLERTAPSAFATPAVQLGVTVDNSQTTNNTLVITAEQGEALTKRSKAIDAEIDKSAEAFLAKRAGSNGTGRDQVAEIEGELVQGPITLPPSPTPAWWRSVSTGSPSRTATQEAAAFIIRRVAEAALGPRRAGGMQMDLKDPITLGDVWNAIGNIQNGWAMLVQKGGG